MVSLAFFLKKSKLKKGLYLQIYQSFYDPDKKGTAHKSFRALGYLDDLKRSGIDDPIAFFSDEIKKLNADLNLKRAQDKLRYIDRSPVRNLGFFPVKCILDGLAVDKHIDLLRYDRLFEFSLSQILADLLFARIVDPCSKFRSFHDVIPYLYGSERLYSYDQLLEALGFLGDEYEKVIEIFTRRVAQRYGICTSTSYFDCTNFYFEIDRETAFQKKGPSKENRSDPIVGMGLLLDANCIPIGMKLYPGNLSEKPVARDLIKDLKQQNQIDGRTIAVADKGINCARNIYEALKNDDGYIFSKSVKRLEDKEYKWIFNKNNSYTFVYDEDHELRYSYTTCTDVFDYEFVNDDNKKIKFTAKEKRVLTFNPTLCRKQQREINKLYEKAKILKAGQAKKSEYGESSKYVKFASTDKEGNVTKEKVAVALDEKKYEKDMALAGYNLLVTSEIKMKDQEIYETYHNLWRIEQSFRIMKSELEARPVFCKTESTIKGHFLICYLAELLVRILEFKILKHQINSTKLYEFMRSYRILKDSTNQYINITSSTPTIDHLSKMLDLPLKNYYLTSAQIKKMLNKVI